MTTTRTVVLNPIEPAFLSLRSATGVALTLNLTFKDLRQTPVNPDTLLAQLAFLPRSSRQVFAYDVETNNVTEGTATVSVPGTALIDPNGYTLELYQRHAAANPADPPVPVGLIAKGVLRLEGAAYFAWGPLAPINVPVIVGPQGPQGEPGEQGVQGEQGERGALWYAGADFPAVSMPSPAGRVNGDMYLKTADPNIGSTWRWQTTQWIFEVSIAGPQGPQGEPGERGSIWTTGTGAPTVTGSELPGDLYLDEATGDVWRFDAVAGWTTGAV